MAGSDRKTGSGRREDAKRRDEFLTQERERVAKRATTTAVSANLLPWPSGLSSISSEMVEAGCDVLCKAQQSGDIRVYLLETTYLWR